MFLALDVGNSSIGFGFFEGHELVQVYHVKTDPNRSIDDYALSLSLFLQSKLIKVDEIEEILVASVVPSFNKNIDGIIESVFKKTPHYIGPKYPSGIRINTDNPKEVGADLIADCAAIRALGLAPAVIADLGTASKLIYSGEDGSFEGCTIAPGIGISLRALIGNAALLGEVDIRIPDHRLGKNTSDSINSALTYGHAYSLIALSNDLEKEAKKPLKRVIGGGYAKILLPLMDEFTYVENLTLLGIHAIYERNRRK